MRAPQRILIALLLLSGRLAPSLANPYAVEVTRAHGPFGASPYDEPTAVLGAPATQFYDPLGAFSGGTTNRRVKLVEGAYNVAPSTNALLTPKLLLTLSGGSEIMVRFDHPVYDDPANPYGIDLLVFGNSFFTPNALVNDSTDMNTCLLTGGAFYEPLKVSVSPGYTGQPGEQPTDPDTWPWYRYDNGPYGDSAFPTQAFQWNRATTNWSAELMDFTKPVNPAMNTIISAGGLSAADAIGLYDGAGGGTGFDLSASGFSWIQYLKVEGIDPDFSDGEIDAVAIVRPMVVGDTLAIAPENILSNTATLCFQQPGAENQNQITLRFNAIDDLAKVATAPLTDLTTFAPLPGPPLQAVQLEFVPLLGTNLANFNANLALAAGPNYSGSGGDLLVLQSSGANWSFLPFTFDPANRRVAVPGITNLSAFVVIRFSPPALQLTMTGPDCNLHFVPVFGLIHTLERSTNLATWSALSSFTASNTLPVVIPDKTPPRENAFYRLKVHSP
jgi:hypothetical protein